jgi:hypothetical protein
VLVLVGAVLVVWPAAAPEVVDVVVDCRTFFVANPTKNVSDPLLALFAPNCLIKAHENATMGVNVWKRRTCKHCA